MYRKSRYFKLRAVIKSAGPRLTKIAIHTNSGNRTTWMPGEIPYQAITPNRKIRFTPKSTSATADEAAGNTNRGKYTLLIKLAFPSKLLDASLTTLENKNQGSMPTKTNRE